MTELGQHILGLSFTTVWTMAPAQKQTYQGGINTAQCKRVGRQIVPPDVCRRLLLTKFQDPGQSYKIRKRLLGRSSDNTTTLMIALTMTAKHPAKANRRIRETDPTHRQKKLTVVGIVQLRTTQRKKARL